MWATALGVPAFVRLSFAPRSRGPGWARTRHHGTAALTDGTRLRLDPRPSRLRGARAVHSPAAPTASAMRQRASAWPRCRRPCTQRGKPWSTTISRRWTPGQTGGCRVAARTPEGMAIGRFMTGTRPAVTGARTRWCACRHRRPRRLTGAASPSSLSRLAGMTLTMSWMSHLPRTVLISLYFAPRAAARHLLTLPSSICARFNRPSCLSLSLRCSRSARITCGHWAYAQPPVFP
jgi:hypothetical protein